MRKATIAIAIILTLISAARAQYDKSGEYARQREQSATSQPARNDANQTNQTAPAQSNSGTAGDKNAHQERP